MRQNLQIVRPARGPMNGTWKLNLTLIGVGFFIILQQVCADALAIFWLLISLSISSCLTHPRSMLSVILGRIKHQLAQSRISLWVALQLVPKSWDFRCLDMQVTHVAWSVCFFCCLAFPFNWTFTHLLFPFIWCSVLANYKEKKNKKEFVRMQLSLIFLP